VQPPKFLSSFGRNRGRALRPYQQGLVDDLLPTLAVDITNPRAGHATLALEIGFGGGEHLLAQASHNRDTLFIGCEPFINGVAKCLVGIAEQKLTNIRLFTNDARQLIEQLPAASVDSVFILFPDPWPKLRHNKRRLVSAHTLSMLARIHKAGGRLLIATDHVDYSVWILETLLNNTDYTWTATEKADWQTPPSDWTTTKYQRKTTEQGRPPMFFECVRR
jgi:tRNA (guanine-N7-)-methyltransferase